MQLGCTRQEAVQSLYQDAITPEFHTGLRKFDKRNEECRDRLLHNALYSDVLVKMSSRKTELMEAVGVWIEHTTGTTIGKDKTKLKKNIHLYEFDDSYLSIAAFAGHFESQLSDPVEVKARKKQDPDLPLRTAVQALGTIREICVDMCYYGKQKLWAPVISTALASWENPDQEKQMLKDKQPRDLKVFYTSERAKNWSTIERAPHPANGLTFPEACEAHNNGVQTGFAGYNGCPVKAPLHIKKYHKCDKCGDPGHIGLTCTNVRFWLKPTENYTFQPSEPFRQDSKPAYRSPVVVLPQAAAKTTPKAPRATPQHTPNPKRQARRRRQQANKFAPPHTPPTQVTLATKQTKK